MTAGPSAQVMAEPGIAVEATAAAKPEMEAAAPETEAKAAGPEKTEPAAVGKMSKQEKPEPEITEKEVKPETIAEAAEPEKSEPAPTAATVKQDEPVRATVEYSAQSNRPRRHGIPRVVLPDLPGLGGPREGLNIRMNGKPLALPPKANGEPYYFMDILQYSGLDFGHLDRPVELLRNGAACEFTQVLSENDDVIVQYQKS